MRAKPRRYLSQRGNRLPLGLALKTVCMDGRNLERRNFIKSGQKRTGNTIANVWCLCRLAKTDVCTKGQKRQKTAATRHKKL